MKLHEYQSKQLFTRYQIPVPRGRIASSAQEARQIASELSSRVVIKAQVLISGRGKAGGIRLAKSPKEAEIVATHILGMDLAGFRVRKILVDEAINIAKEIYLGIIIDRENYKPMIIASIAGGVDIEEIAKQSPEKIVRIQIDPLLGLRNYQARDLALGIDLDREYWRSFIDICQGMWKLFSDYDATMVEINPLVITTDRTLTALDGKTTIDDNALFRHPELAEMRDNETEALAEIEAKKYGLSYIKMDGEVGCLVNGAGLAMTTMDVIKEIGGRPANFLDIGGGASAEKVAAAFRILQSDPAVKSILVNIFGGITRCDEVAKGILMAVKENRPRVPFAIRLAGVNAEEGLKILHDENLITAESLAEAARKTLPAPVKEVRS
jgi:succinyl-CoA synthetase beta subunit